MPHGDNSAPRKRVGLLGIGQAGLQHARAVAACGHLVASAAASGTTSPRLEAFRRAAPDAKIVIGIDALLADDSLDAIIAALPWDVGPRHLDDLLRHPKPVLLEKPIALDAASIARALCAPGAKSKNKMVGFNRRFYGTSARMRARLAEGGLKAVRVTISEDLTRQERAHGAAVLGHLMAFSSSHALDLVRHLLGELKIVRLYGHAERDVPFLSINGLLETRDGVPVLLTLNASDPSPAGISFVFADRTTWNLSPLEMLAVFDRYEVVELRPGSQIRRYMPHLRDMHDETADFKPGFVQQMAAFLAGDFGPGATPEDALAVQTMIEAMARAAHPGA